MEIDDYTGDGIVDLLVASREQDGVYLLLGRGHGFFDDRHPTFFQTGDSPGQILVGQFDASPGWDLAAINFGSDDVTVYYDFASDARRVDLRPAASGQSGGFQPRAGVLVDVNSDQQQELFVASRNGSISRWLTGPNGFSRFETVADAQDVVRTASVTISAMELVSPRAGGSELRFALSGIGDEPVFYWSTRNRVEAWKTPGYRPSGGEPDFVAAAGSALDFGEFADETDIRASGGSDDDAVGEAALTARQADDSHNSGRMVGGSSEDLPPAGLDPMPPSEDWKDLLRRLAYQSTERVLAALNLPVAPDAVYDLLIAAGTDIQSISTADKSERFETLPVQEQGQQHGDGTRTTDSAFKESALAEWWDVYGETLADWQPPARRLPISSFIYLVGKQLLSAPLFEMPRDLSDQSEPLLALPTPSLLNPIRPDDEDPAFAPESSTTASADLEADRHYATWAILGTVAMASLAAGVYRLQRRSRRRDGRVLDDYLAAALPSGGPPYRKTYQPNKFTSEAIACSCELNEGEAMTRPVKNLLPDQWWEVARCVDEYEAALKDGFPDLRQLTASVSPQERSAACLELAAVDMEHRFKAGESVTVEHYLDELADISSDSQSINELIAEEYRLRCRCGEQPSVNEYRRRFPDHNIDSLLRTDPDPTLAMDSGTKPMRKREAIPLPATIGRYHVCEEIGAGTFGRVYRCHDSKLRRDVAIKVPHPDTTLTSERIQGYLHEARGAARLSHPGIISVLDTGELEDGRGYVVYEYVPGRTLRQRIQQNDYTREQAVGWCIEIAEALHYAHTRQVVHRDVTPANVLLDSQGHVRLTDFGLAKVDDQFYRDDTGRVVGTVAYLAPEQAHGDSKWASPQADIYALGVVLYELLTHRRPLTRAPVACLRCSIRSSDGSPNLRGRSTRRYPRSWRRSA